MSNDLQQARVTAAAKAMWGRDLEKSKEFYPERPSMWAKERPAYAEYAALALAAADAVVTVEMIAEAIAKVTDLWDEPLDEVHDIPPIARAVLALVRGGWE